MNENKADIAKNDLLNEVTSVGMEYITDVLYEVGMEVMRGEKTLRLDVTPGCFRLEVAASGVKGCERASESGA